MIETRSFILPKGALSILLVVTGALIGIEKLVSHVINDYTTANPKVVCRGIGFDDPAESSITRINIDCGGQKTYSDVPRVIARYATNPKAPIICALRKSGSIACDK